MLNSIGSSFFIAANLTSVPTNLSRKRENSRESARWLLKIRWVVERRSTRFTTTPAAPRAPKSIKNNLKLCDVCENEWMNECCSNVTWSEHEQTNKWARRCERTRPHSHVSVERSSQTKLCIHRGARMNRRSENERPCLLQPFGCLLLEFLILWNSTGN